MKFNFPYKLWCCVVVVGGGWGDIMMLVMGALDSKAGVSSVSTWFDKINP